MNIIKHASSGYIDVNFPDTILPCIIREKSKLTNKINYAGRVEVKNLEEKTCTQIK